MVVAFSLTTEATPHYVDHVSLQAAQRDYQQLLEQCQSIHTSSPRLRKQGRTTTAACFTSCSQPGSRTLHLIGNRSDHHFNQRRTARVNCLADCLLQAFNSSK